MNGKVPKEGKDKGEDEIIEYCILQNLYNGRIIQCNIVIYYTYTE